MKRCILTALCVLGLTGWASAGTFTAQCPIGDLGHDYHFTWGINWSVPAGELITSAELTLTGIRNYRDEANVLYLSLLPDAPDSAQNPAVGHDAGGTGNAFSAGVQIAAWSDPDGQESLDNLAYSLEPLGLLDELNQFAQDGDFAIGLDPDCHFSHNGIAFRITTEARPTVPDGGATLMLLGSALMGLEGLRRMLRR